MGIKEKLPLINSENKKIRIAGYMIYAWLGLSILGSLIPSQDTNISENQTINNETPRPLDHIDVGTIIGRSLFGDDREITVEGNDSIGYITTIVLEAPEDDIYSNDKFLRDTSKTFTEMLEKLFKDDRIQGVVLTQNLNFNDKYGNKQELPAITVSMTKSTARKITNWDNFKQLVEIDYNTLFDASDDYTVSPVLLRD